MEHVTKKVQTTQGPDGAGNDSTLTTEYEALNSIEIGETAKGEVQIKSVKVYGNDANEMLLEVKKVYDALTEMLGGNKRVGG